MQMKVKKIWYFKLVNILLIIYTPQQVKLIHFIHLFFKRNMGVYTLEKLKQNKIIDLNLNL